MTAQETYINSFCKNAESLGYDPYSLAKYAMSYDKLTKSAGLGMLLRQGIGRVGQLVFGGVGRGPALKQIAKYNKQLLDLKNTLKRAKEAYRAVGNPKADWSHIQKLRNQIYDVRKAIKQTYKPIASETRKVYAARAGVGALGIGGVGLYMNKNNKENQDFGTEDYYMD